MPNHYLLRVGVCKRRSRRCQAQRHLLQFICALKTMNDNQLQKKRGRGGGGETSNIAPVAASTTRCLTSVMVFTIANLLAVSVAQSQRSMTHLQWQLPAQMAAAAVAAYGRHGCCSARNGRIVPAQHEYFPAKNARCRSLTYHAWRHAKEQRLS
jgi:hypothetical protein